jgi:hypothetical protein
VYLPGPAFQRRPLLETSYDSVIREGTPSFAPAPFPADPQVSSIAQALREQSEEVRILREETERDIQQRRRSQASRVFIHQEAAPAERDPQMAAAQMDDAIRSHDETTTLVAARLSNTSKQPVYDIAIRWSVGGGPLGGPHLEPHLMPGKKLLRTQSWTPAAGITGLAVKVEFSDAAGIRWRATDRGELAELCTATRPPPDTAHCGYAPDHKGDHGWDLPANKLLVTDSTPGAADDPLMKTVS